MSLSRAALIAAMGLWVSQARGEFVPTPGHVDTRVRTAAYNPDQVYRLQGVMGFAIDLVFAPDEECTGISGGDLDAVVVAANGHRLTIKPKLAPVATNFTVLTNKRTYRIEYHVAPPDDGTVEPQIFSVEFNYAPPKASSPSLAEKVQQALESPRPSLNRDYWYCGHVDLQPVAASDDGLHTRLTFSRDTEWPAIYLLNRDGSESLVNLSVQGNTAVIHRLFERVILRRGNLVGCVFNGAVIRAQSPPQSGTVSPEVSRVLKGTRR